MILNFEELSIDSPLKKNFGETASAALNDNLSFFDFSIISKKQSQFLYVTIPGHDSQMPKINPERRVIKLFIFF